MTTIVFGPPGTGKTTTLLSAIKKSISDGVRPDRTAFVAFTRKAASEARTRGASELGLSEDDMVNWRTLHSTAARQIGSAEIMSSSEWNLLGDALGLKFGDLDETGEPLGLRSERGTQLRHLEGLARATRTPLREVWMQSSRGVSWIELDRFSRALESYKRELGLLDYSDLLDQAPGDVGADVVILDEAQDLTLSQWSYFRRAFPSASRVLVAGDDDQSLFDWAGATVDELLNLDGDRVVLRQSYRLPSSVHDLACRVSSRIARRQPKTWAGKSEVGVVSDATYPDSVDVEEGEWLLLARTRALLDNWEHVCRERGVPFVRAGRSSIGRDDAVAIRAWETLRRGSPVRGDEAASAMSAAGIVSDLDGTALFEASDLAADFSKPWKEALVKIPPAKRRYYEACLRRNSRALTDPPIVSLSTIHGSKGGEADNVAVLTDTTPLVDGASHKNPDAEHRVWYVAVTRTRRVLRIVRPLTDRSYSIPT